MRKLILLTCFTVCHDAHYDLSMRAVKAPGRVRLCIHTIYGKLGPLDSDKGVRIMPCSEKGRSILATILIIIHSTNPIFRNEQKFDESSPFMKLGRNWEIND